MALPGSCTRALLPILVLWVLSGLDQHWLQSFYVALFIQLKWLFTHQLVAAGERNPSLVLHAMVASPFSPAFSSGCFPRSCSVSLYCHNLSVSTSGILLPPFLSAPPQHCSDLTPSSSSPPSSPANRAWLECTLPWHGPIAQCQCGWGWSWE